MLMNVNWTVAQRYFSKFPFSVFLAGLSIVYGLGVKVRSVAYSYGLIKRQELPGFVLSVGNITAGGTGKTPAVIMIAQWARNQGYSVCVLSRGYGGNYKGQVLEVSDGRRLKASWFDSGDEPYLIARKLDGVPVVVAKKRYLGGCYAREKFGTDFFVLDDGYQHLSLKRNLDLLLIDSDDAAASRHLIPWGRLREPVSAICRADIIVLSNFNYTVAMNPLPSFARARFSDSMIFQGSHIPTGVVLLGNRSKVAPEWLKGKDVGAFAGIGKPEGFKETLLRLGARVVFFRAFSDHHIYTQKDIQRLIDIAKKKNLQYLLTTEKDWVKIQDLVVDDFQIGYVAIRFDLMGRERDFFKIIEDSVQRLR